MSGLMFSTCIHKKERPPLAVTRERSGSAKLTSITRNIFFPRCAAPIENDTWPTGIAWHPRLPVSLIIILDDNGLPIMTMPRRSPLRPISLSNTFFEPLSIPGNNKSYHNGYRKITSLFVKRSKSFSLLVCICKI